MVKVFTLILIMNVVLREIEGARVPFRGIGLATTEKIDTNQTLVSVGNDVNSGSGTVRII